MRGPLSGFGGRNVLLGDEVAVCGSPRTPGMILCFKFMKLLCWWAAAMKHRRPQRSSAEVTYLVASVTDAWRALHVHAPPLK